MNLLTNRLNLARLFTIFVLLVIPAASPVTSAPADQDMPETPAQQQYETWPPRPPKLDGLTQPATNALSSQSDSRDNLSYDGSQYIENVTQAVFAGYFLLLDQRRWQWDIFRVQRNLFSDSVTIQLTNTAATDIYPKLSSDAQWIVFVSDQNGNDEIYKMRVNGTERTQLTSERMTDTEPVFSPDGTQVAFVSNRVNGNADIFIMGSSGGAVRRLTTAPNLDVEPDWSPDGKKIAWMRRSGSIGYLCVMNADGSGGETVLAALPYGGRPSWSPDSKQIAYEFDANGDGWLELGVINPDGSGLAMLQIEKEAYTDLSMGSWYGKPGEEGLIYGKIVYYFYNNQWMISDSAAYFTRQGQNFQDHKIFISDRMAKTFYPHARTWDITPPQVRVLNSLPRYSPRFFDLPITIIDQTQGEYNIEYKYSLESSWQDLVTGNYDPGTGTQWSSTLSFGFNPGNTVFLRISARDIGNNASDPNTFEPLSTTIYKFSAKASVQDMRETPLSGVVINAGPNGIDQPVETRHGTADLYYKDNRSQTLAASLSKSGFGSLPNPIWPVGAEREFLSVLPPQENQIVNGYFEDSPGLLTGWQTKGKLPISATNGRYNGSAARLGMKCYTGICFTLPEKVTITEGSGGGVSLSAIDSSGGLHFLVGVRYIYRSPAGLWEERASLTSPSSYPIQSVGTLSLLPDGRPFLWIHANEYYLAVMTTSGDWAYETIPNEIIRAVSDSLGQIHVLYQDMANQAIAYRKRLPTGEWNAPVQVWKFSSWAVLHTSAFNARIAAGADGEAHIVFYNYDVNSNNISYIRILQNGTVQPLESISGIYSMERLYNFPIELFMGPGGILYLFVDASHNSYIWSRSASGSWGVPIHNVIFTPYGDSLRFVKGELAPNNDIYLYYAYDYSNSDLGKSYCGFYEVIKREGESSFRYNRFLDENCMVRLSPAIDSSGLLHILWQNNASISTYYQKQQVLTERAEASLSQTLTVPANLQMPTLSFFYHLEGDIPNENTSIRVSLTPQGGDPSILQEVNASNQTTAWKHAWFDLTPWQGQTVELAFTLEQTPGLIGANLSVDEVTLGAWTTPVANFLTPYRIDWPVGENTWIEINGENLMDGIQVWFGDQPAAECAWVSSALVRCRPPSGLPYGLYTLRLENPGGASADSLHALVVGGVAYLPMTGR